MLLAESDQIKVAFSLHKRNRESHIIMCGWDVNIFKPPHKY